jgi:hypothetical protein
LNTKNLTSLGGKEYKTRFPGGSAGKDRQTG